MIDSPLPRREATVLIANDHEWAARSLESILTAEGYRVVRAYTGRQALEAAGQTQPDAMVLDFQMPDIDGLQVCRALRADPRFGTTIPIFITTAGPSGRNERLNAYRAGAWEFFGQPLDGEAILLKLKTFLQSKTVVDELRRESLVDHETGLYSRKGLLRRGRELASEAARRGVSLACVVFAPESAPLHAAVQDAERLASRVSEVFRAAGRSSDAIGRLGTLQFGLVAVGSGAAEAEQLIKRLTAIAARWPTDPTGDGPSVSLRGAYCVVDNAAEQPPDPAQMLETAADAVYEAATTARRRVVGL